VTRNLLLLTYYFPPEDNIGAQRFGKMCRYMEGFGWRPHVICPESTGHSTHGLPEDRVLRVGRQTSGPAREKNMDSASPVSRLLYRMGKAVRFDLRAFDASAVTWFREVIRSWPSLSQKLPEIDLVVSGYGPSAPHWLGRRISRRLAVPWVADYRDPCSLYPYGRNALVGAIDRLIERFLLRGAAGFTIVSETWTEMTRAAFGLAGACVFNGWDESERVGADRADYLYYGGRLYPNQQGSVRMLLEAMARVPGSRLLFLSTGPADLTDWFRGEVRRLGLQARVEIRPPVPPAEAAALAAGARATIVVHDADNGAAWSTGCIPGKLLQQIGLPAPILCIAHPDSETGAVLARTRKGKLCATVDEIVSFLDAVAADDHPYQGDEVVIDSFSREAQARVFCAFLDECSRAT